MTYKEYILERAKKEKPLPGFGYFGIAFNSVFAVVYGFQRDYTFMTFFFIMAALNVFFAMRCFKSHERYVNSISEMPEIKDPVLNDILINQHKGLLTHEEAYRKMEFRFNVMQGEADKKLNLEESKEQE